MRYHQIGVCSGWVEIDGERTEISPDTWVSTRDHSWGVRYDVGAPATDLEPGGGLEGRSFQFVWSPVLMERPDGSRYGLFLNVAHVSAPGFQQRTTTGLVEHVDGTVEHIDDVEFDLAYDPVNRRLKGGRLDATMADGSHRPLQVEVLSDTGFHLGAGLYFGFNGHHHGEWRGPLVVEGERIADCTDRRERPAPAPDPRHRRAGHRPRGRGRGRRQHAAHRLGHVPAPRPRRRVLLHVVPACPLWLSTSRQW